MQVVLYRLLGNEHFLGNLFVFVALGNQDDDLAFALAKLSPLPGGLPVTTVNRGKIGRGGKLPDNGGGGSGVEPDLAGMDLADALFDEVRGGILRDDPHTAELHRLDKLF